MTDATPRSILLLIEPLTRREGEVLDELATGATNAQIAVTLVVTEKTIKAHLGNIYEKLGVTNRVEAVIAGQELGLVAVGGQLSPEAAAIVVLARLHPGALKEAARVLTKGVVDSGVDGQTKELCQCLSSDV